MKHPNTNNWVKNNFSKVNYAYLILPFIVLLTCFVLFCILKKESYDYTSEYINIQKESFYYLNSKLSEFPVLESNLTLLGDVIILFPFVSVLALYSPKLWQAIITSSLLSLIVSATLKKIFNVPRPAAILDNDSFVILGRTLTSNTSLPSGHSMTTFIVTSLLLLAFMPKKNWHKVIWCITIVVLSFVITFSRVGVGAHYPLDVVIGSTIGYILSVVGIQLSMRFNYSGYLSIKKQSLILLIIYIIWLGLVINKIISTQLLMTYLSLVSLIITIYITLKFYVQKKN